MRLSTHSNRDEANGIALIHAALDAGVRLLDTADSYCLDESDTGHNERLIAKALRSWGGDASSVEVATKGGLRRPDGAWVPDGRAVHLKAACEASRQALDVEVIELYQLHVVDPRVPFETVTAQDIALVWLRDLGSNVIPIPGPTNPAHAAALARVPGIELTAEERAQLQDRFGGRVLRVPRSQRRPPAGAGGDVV